MINRKSSRMVVTHVLVSGPLGKKEVLVCFDEGTGRWRCYIEEHLATSLGLPWPDVYSTNVMIFGASCIPASVHFVKNPIAQEFQGQFPAACDAILNTFYMDDYMDSVARSSIKNTQRN